MKCLLKAVVFASLVGTSSVAVAQDTGPLTGQLDVRFDVVAETGTIMVALFEGEAAYNGGSPVRVAQIKVAEGERQAVFEGLAKGAYGIKAFHDVNDNGQMDTNPFGIPIEPLAFSNNAPVNMGPAKWELARFEVTGATVQSLNMR